MGTDQLLGEIRDTNLNYLLLAQQMVNNDKAAALYRLGISQEVGDLLARLTPAQIMKMANSNMLLCRLRFDDNLVFGLLVDHGKAKPLAQSHAAVLMAGQPAAGLV